MELIFGKYGKFERKINANQCPRWSRGRGVRLPPWARPYPRKPPVRQLTLFFCCKKANIRKKITAKVSGQSELRISIYIRNGETEPEQNAEPERNREIDPISEGLSPLPCHGGQGPEGKPFSHLGRRSRKKKKKGGPSPPCFRWRRSAAGASVITAIFTNNFTAIITNSSPLYAAV